MADTAVAPAAGTEGGGEPAPVPSAGDAAATVAGGQGVAETASAAAAGGSSGGGDPAGGPAAAEKRASNANKEATPAPAPAPSSNVPVKEPLGPGPFSLDDFDAGVTLGTGSFGRVRIATHKTTQTPWAIKILKKAEIVRMQQVMFLLTVVLGCAQGAVSFALGPIALWSRPSQFKPTEAVVDGSCLGTIEPAFVFARQAKTVFRWTTFSYTLLTIEMCSEEGGGSRSPKGGR